MTKDEWNKLESGERVRFTKSKEIYRLEEQDSLGRWIACLLQQGTPVKCLVLKADPKLFSRVN